MENYTHQNLGFILLTLFWKKTFVYHTKYNVPGNFILNNKFSANNNLKCLKVHKGSETLGVIITMDGNQTDELKNLRENSKFFTNRIWTSHYDANTTIYTYNSCFNKSMEYCMPVTNLSENIWNHIVTQAKPHSLQQARIVPNFHLLVFYCPQLYNGYSFDHSHFKQGLEKNRNLDSRSSEQNTDWYIDWSYCRGTSVETRIQYNDWYYQMKNCKRVLNTNMVWSFDSFCYNIQWTPGENQKY